MRSPRLSANVLGVTGGHPRLIKMPKLLFSWSVYRLDSEKDLQRFRTGRHQRLRRR